MYACAHTDNMHAYAHGCRLIFLLFHTPHFKNLIKCILKYHSWSVLSQLSPSPFKSKQRNREREEGEEEWWEDERRSWHACHADTRPPSSVCFPVCPLPSSHGGTLKTRLRGGGSQRHSGVVANSVDLSWGWSVVSQPPSDYGCDLGVKRYLESS